MAAEDLGVVGQAEKAAFDAFAQLSIVATSEVGAPDAAAEECVAGEDPALQFGIEADAALGVAGRADDLKRAVADLDDVAVVKEVVGQLEFAVERQPEKLRLLLGAHIVGLRLAVRRPLDAITTLDSGVAKDVVDVAMRADNQNGLQPMAVDEAKEFALLGGVGAARVDDEAFLGVVVVNDVGVFRKRIEDEGFELEHG